MPLAFVFGLQNFRIAKIFPLHHTQHSHRSELPTASSQPALLQLSCLLLFHLTAALQAASTLSLPHPSFFALRCSAIHATRCARPLPLQGEILDLRAPISRRNIGARSLCDSDERRLRLEAIFRICGIQFLGEISGHVVYATPMIGDSDDRRLRLEAIFRICGIQYIGNMYGTAVQFSSSRVVRKRPQVRRSC